MGPDRSLPAPFRLPSPQRHRDRDYDCNLRHHESDPRVQRAVLSRSHEINVSLATAHRKQPELKHALNNASLREPTAESRPPVISWRTSTVRVP